MPKIGLPALLLTVSCVPSPWHTTPPQLLAAVVDGERRELALEFDQPVDRAALSGDVDAASVTVEGARVTGALNKGLVPGKRYGWAADIQDRAGNQTTLAGRFYGPNDHPAMLRLNEVRVAGSGDHTDFVELSAQSAGSLGGWTLDVYASSESRQRLVLPDTPVTKGELVVVRYIDGPSDTKGAREFRPPEGKGLSAAKGLLILRPSPSAPPTDGLLYSKTPGAGADLARDLGWSSAELNPEYCTPTRTWNRVGDGWMLAATGGATPGQPNSTTIWAGPTTPRKPSKTKSRPRRDSIPERRGARVASSTPGDEAESPSRSMSRARHPGARTGTRRYDSPRPTLQDTGLRPPRPSCL